jgi:hypothetical protein
MPCRPKRRPLRPPLTLRLLPSLNLTLYPRPNLRLPCRTRLSPMPPDDEPLAPLEVAVELPRFEDQPVYTLDFDHTFDPFGILPKVDAPEAPDVETCPKMPGSRCSRRKSRPSSHPKNP